MCPDLLFPVDHVQRGRSDMASRPAVLVVEDEKAISDLVAFHLDQTGFEPIVAGDARRALELTRDRLPALVILDLMLPDMDGLDILKIFRGQERSARLPVILLTARAEEADRILGLEIGADDYVVKPFSPRELMLRVERLIASRENMAAASHIPLVFGCLEIDEQKFRVTVSAEPVEISATEMRLLCELIRCRGTVLSRSQLLQNAWGYMPNVTERTVDTHVKRLRQKLGAASDYLETVRGVGYRWLENAPDAETGNTAVAER
jgi:two-component system phosphate regulon response regulator PhoB